MGAGKERGLLNHGTIAILIRNTIQSRHELCGYGESNDSLKRITKANQTLNSTKVKSIL